MVLLLSVESTLVHAATLSAGAPAAVSLLLLFLALRKDTALMQARIYLHFPRLHRFHYSLIVLAALIIAGNLAYTASGLSPLLQPGLFYPFGVFLVCFHLLLVGLAIFHILTLGERRSRSP